MIYKVIKRLIELGNTDGLAARMDVLYAAGKLSDTEYTELTSLLTAATAA